MAAIAVCLVNSTFAVASSPPGEALRHAHQAGVRLGVWGNLGQTPPATDLNDNFQSDVGSASFYLEGFAGYRLFGRGVIELAIGTVNRGDVSLRTAGGQRIGNLLIMPFMLNFRFYPILPKQSKVYPYVFAGVGLFYGRRNVQFIEINDPLYSELNEESRYSFNYTVGAGADWALARSLALEFQARYLPISFSENLALIRDYEAVAFTVGIKYLHYRK